MRERVLSQLQSRAGTWTLAALAFVLALPSLPSGLASDDFILGEIARRSFDPFAVFRLRGDEVTKFRELGYLAWWSTPDVSVYFFRPLSTLLHELEFHLWPSAAWAMHLVNLGVYAAMVVAACLTYRALQPSQPRVAAFAALLFTIDDSHGPAVGWISSRNTVFAGMFGLSALYFHVRARTPGSRAPMRLHAASTACILLALLAAEAGVAAFAYLLAYAAVVERGSWARRARTLLPQLGVFALWAGVYLSGGFGVRGASFYREPHQLYEGLFDLPTWLFSMFGPSIIGAGIAFDPWAVRAGCALLVLPFLAAGYLALPRTRLNAFFLLGSLLCLPPLFTTLPQDRLLFTASFGAFGLLASFITTAGRSALRFVRFIRIELIVLHVVLAPLLFVFTLDQVRPLQYGADEITAAVGEPAPAQVILLNQPLEMVTLYAWAVRAYDRTRTRPESMHQLYAGASAVDVTRIDATTLEMHVHEGWARIPFERVFGSVRGLPPAGAEVNVESMQIRVRESTPDGRPRRVQFQFPNALESEGRLWLAWSGKKPLPWTPPPIGKTVPLEQLAFFTSLQL